MGKGTHRIIVRVLGLIACNVWKYFLEAVWGGMAER